ncbi:molybdopterin converting factor subunit 1 [Halobacillus sp. A1]|uniref:molybdopterin converting factor subunit 1 n=1 Tax=Halobacillus sp. A1 TaxID=2880262 RepID=UPI0020A6848D|nr:molybdopterin converting factor subunit 1 [Halobacillus sp. A1]MCP3031995.1 molybdopterin converting factor subunit 1 [Halobacillus sp. A1]
MNKILFFAALQEKAGKESIELDVSGKSVKEVKEFVALEYGLAKINESMTAINEEFAANDDVIQENDVIAFIPPVSGG